MGPAGTGLDGQSGIFVVLALQKECGTSRHNSNAPGWFGNSFLCDCFIFILPISQI